MSKHFLKIRVGILILLLICGNYSLPGIAICLNTLKMYTGDIYTVQELPVVQNPANSYTNQSRIIHPWHGVTYGPVTEPSVSSEAFNNYIKKPYSNPNLIQEQQQQKLDQEKIKAEQTLAQTKEHSENMAVICQNFYQSRRQKDFLISQPVVYHTKIMSFKNFAESCENYEKNNHLIWSGLNASNNNSESNDSE